MKKSTKDVFEFSFPGHVSQRHWSVYVISAIPKLRGAVKLYVGKVGDNRSGCNPMISRIGNHFSHNKIHSQLRKKIEDLERFDYHVRYITFGEYNSTTKKLRDRVNELERQLNRRIAEKIEGDKNYELLNRFKGVGYLSQEQKMMREKLLSIADKNKLVSLIEKVFSK